MLLYRSTHRGCKELDILIGEFAKYSLNELSSQELVEYAQLLQIDDVSLYNWIINKEQPSLLFANSSVLKKLTERYIPHSNL